MSRGGDRDDPIGRATGARSIALKTSRKRPGIGVNSTAVVVALAADAIVEIPKFVSLTPAEAALWPIFAGQRTADDWSDSDLVLLAKVVQLEAMIRDDRAILLESRPVIQQPNGARVANPLIAVIDTLQRQQLSIMRMLSLTAQDDGRQRASRARKVRTISRAIGDDDDLIAKPH